MGKKFIISSSTLCLPGTPPAIHLTYDVNLYEDILFAQEGIPFPPQLAKARAKRKAEFLAGRIAAREALRQKGILGCQVGIGKDRCPLWPQGVSGSISHTECAAVCIVAEKKKHPFVGIDLQQFANPAAVAAILQRVFCEQERTLLARGTALCCTIGFSAKESLFKALYPTVERYFGFECARIVQLDRDKQMVTLALTTQLHSTLPIGSLWQIHFDVFAGQVLTCLVSPRIDTYHPSLDLGAPCARGKKN